MKPEITKLNNNFPLLYVNQPGSESAIVTVWVKTGSRNEDKKVNGISHFLEHMLLKGGKKRPSPKEVSNAVDAFGGEFNAGTSKDFTLYYIKSDLGSLDKAFDVLSDIVLHPILDSKEMEKEKGVIVEEIKMYEDMPIRNIHDIYENISFEGNSLSWDISGTEESVRTVMRKDFVDYRSKFYHPQNMLITVVGGVSQTKAKQLANKYFSGYKPGVGEGVVKSDFFENQNKPRLFLKTKPIEQANILVGFPTQGRSYKNRFAQAVLSSILGGGMSSRLFTEVREKRGLAYAVKNSIERYQEVGYIGTYAGTDPKKATEALKVILDECYKTTKKGNITKKEFEKARGYLKGHLALSLEDSGAVTDFFAEQYLFNKKVLTPKEVIKEIEKVTIDDVVSEAYNIFTKNKVSLAVIGPFKDKKMFEKVIN